MWRQRSRIQAAKEPAPIGKSLKYCLSQITCAARDCCDAWSVLNDAVPGSPQRIAFLKDSIADYSQLIKTFRSDREELKRRRAIADDAETLRLDQGLRVNQRGLELLENALARIQAELDEELSK